MDLPQKAVKGLLKETGKLFKVLDVAWNPETDISAKREWATRNSAAFSRSSTGATGTTDATDGSNVSSGNNPPSPASSSQAAAGPGALLPMYDYFVVVGLEDRPETVDAVWKKEKAQGQECMMRDAKVLYSFPERGMPEDLRREIPTYCFPIGTGAYAVRRSAGSLDLTEITDVVYGQHYDSRSDASFVFQLQTTAADRPTPEMLYGVCFYRKEFLHRRPKMFDDTVVSKGGIVPEDKNNNKNNNLPERLVASGRCYCLLSRVPMFGRHFELLRNILSYERHHQIEEYARQVDEGLWTGDRAGAGIGAGARCIDSAKPSEDEELSSYRSRESQSTLDTPSFSNRKSVTMTDQISSSSDDSDSDDAAASRPISASRKPHHERKVTSISDFHTPEDTPSAPLLMDDDGDDDDMTPFFTAGDRGDRGDRRKAKGMSTKTKRTISRRLEYSRQRTQTTSTDDDLEAVRKNLTMMRVLDDTDDMLMGAAAAADAVDAAAIAIADAADDMAAGDGPSMPGPLNNDSTELGSWIEADDRGNVEDTAASKPVAREATRPTSPIGQAWYKRDPRTLLEQYKALDYRLQVAAKEIAVPVSNLINARGETVSSMKCTFMSDIDFLAAKELESWAICVLCRALSVENIVTYLTAVLLERQIVVFESNIAYLSAIVLSLQPLLLPFSWQSLLLPVVPVDKQDLLEAPVPFVIGMLTKTRDIRAKCGSLVRINAYKDDVKNAGSFPRLPNAKALTRELEGPHARIRRFGVQFGSDSCPIYEISSEERQEAAVFAEKVRQHLMALTSELAFFMISDVGSATSVGILMRDAFVESFEEGEDRDFIDQWTQSQMFELYADWVQHN